MKKSGKLKGLLYGLPIALASFLPMKSQAQERLIIDNFSQPNDTTLNYYGSGDVNEDNVLNWNDYYAMGSFQNDMSDINGDGVINNNDKVILQNYLNGNLNHLPSDWNKLNTTEKTNWFEKMVRVDQTDTISASSIFDCGHFAVTFAINFHGFKSLEDGVSSDFRWRLFTKNSRFNIPVTTVGTMAIFEQPHAINGVLIGDNPLNFSDWYFVEPQTDQKVLPGISWSMYNNNRVYNNSIQEINPKDGAISELPLILWYLDENGVPTLLDSSLYMVTSNPNKDTTPPQLNLSSPVTDSIYNHSEVNLEYLVKENQTFLDSCKYKLNNASWQYIRCIDSKIPIFPTDSISGTISLPAIEGENNLIFYASDIAKPETNKATKNIKFFVDKTPPTTSDDVPEAWQNSDFNVTLTPNDALSGVVSTKYCISSSDDYCTPDTEYTEPVSITDENAKYFRYFSTDKAENKQDIVSRAIKLDKTTPEIDISSPEANEFYKDMGEVRFTITDANLDSCFYSADNGQTKTYFPYTSGLESTLNITSNEGPNKWALYAKDKAGNKLEQEIEFIVDKTTPKIDITSPESKKYAEEVNDFVFTVTDANLDSCFYSADNGQTKTYFPCTSGAETTLNITSNEGLNNWSLYAKDKAGNKLEQNVVFEFVPDSVEENPLEKSFKEYPNPTTGPVNFEFYLNTPENLRFNVYNIAGKELENIVVEGNPGENKISYDFSKYSSGFYIYRFEGSGKRNVKTGKIIKR